ncbi:MAG: short-chain dehydrogenase [Acidobacteria bacterium]|nr:MAG: short-chain dehydrogenase [Acidobacteriota bacterium]
MSTAGKYALVTGSSRGIGRGIAIKLAGKGARVAVHYYQNEDAAKVTLSKVRECGSDGFLVQADVCRHEDVGRMFGRVKAEFGKLDIFVHNARPDLPGFYTGPMNITLEQWDTALNSQAKAFLVGAREASQLMRDGGRIIGITYAPGGRFGSWQPWVAMGSAKAAMESLCRYFAVALARRRITVNAISPGWIEDSVLNTLPKEAQQKIRDWHEGGWIPMGHLGTPADIGNAVALLCSDEASWITGQTLAVDGGASLMETVMPLDMQQAVPRAAEVA